MRRYIKPAAFLFITAAIIFMTKHYGFGDNMINSLLELRELASSRPVTAALIYIIAASVGCVLLALPGAAFAAAAGLIFEPVTGTLLCLIAATLGAVLAFLAGRYFIKDAVRPWLERNALLKKFLLDDVSHSGAVLLMITRLVPLFPYNLQNFAYGLTGISLRQYTLYTFIFMMPGAAAFTIGAAGIGEPEHRRLYFMLAAVIAVLVTLAGMILKKRFIK